MFVDWFYYRADWLEELGYSEPPKTWQEFREVAKAMTSGDRYGVALRGGAGGGEPVIKMIRGYNGPLTDADGAPTLDLEATKTALDEYSALYLVDKSAPPSAPADGYNQIFQSFLNGQTGMLMHHTGSLEIGHRRAQDRRAGTHRTHADYSRRHHRLAAADGQRHREPR